MKFIIAIALFFFISVPSYSKEVKKPKIAMVMMGGNINTALFLGMIKGAKDSDLAPDYVVAVCGSSISAAIAHSIEGYEEQLEFIKSKEYYNMLNSIGMTGYSNLGKSIGLISKFYEEFKSNRVNATIGDLEKKALWLLTNADESKGIIPNLNNTFLLKMPQSLDLPELKKGFESKKHKTIIVSSKILYSDSDIGRKRKDGEDLYQEVLFTDEETAKKLVGIKSPNSIEKYSSVKEKIQIITDATLEEATRASISDPFLMEPAELKGEQFLTGAINHYPFEIARKVADEIITVYPTNFDIVEEGAILATFGFSQNKRFKKSFTEDLEYSIDVTDFPSELSLSPKPSIGDFEIQSNIPDNYHDYRDLVTNQFNFGYRRMIEASKNKNSFRHIRSLKDE